MLDMNNQVNIAYIWDLKGFLAIIDDNYKYKAVIKVKKPLIKKSNV